MNQVYFRKAAQLEAPWYLGTVERLLEGTGELPANAGKTLILGFPVARLPVAACEVAVVGGIAHVRYGVDESYRDSGVEEALLERATLAARTSGAREMRLSFAQGDERTALIARQNAMRVDRSGEQWIAEKTVAPGDAFAFGLECFLSAFFPVPA